MTDNKEKTHPSRPKSSYKERPSSKTHQQKKEEGPPRCNRCSKEGDVYKFSCPHSFCIECLVKLSISTNFEGMSTDLIYFHCPLCQGEGEASFEIDSWINILEYLNKEKNEKNKMLQIENKQTKKKCSQHKDKDISCYCAYCKIWLCDQCRSSFHDTYYPDHALYDNEDIQIFCEEHKETFVDFYCLKCQKDVCSKCIGNDGPHSLHRYISRVERDKKKNEHTHNSDYLQYKTFDEFDQRLECLKQNFFGILKNDSDNKNQEIENLIHNLRVLQNDYKDQEQKFIEEMEKIFQILKLSYFIYFSTDPKERDERISVSNSLIDIKLISSAKVNTKSMINSFENQINEYQAKQQKVNDKNVHFQLIWDGTELDIDKQIPENLDDAKQFKMTQNGSFEQDNSSKKDEQHMDGITKIIELPHLNAIASASIDSRIMVWDIETGKRITTMEGHKSSIWCLILKSTQELISGSSDKTAKIWKYNGGDQYSEWLTLRGHQGTVYSIAEFKDGKIITGSEDKTIRIWELPNPDKPQIKPSKYLSAKKVISTLGSVNSITNLIDDFIIAGESTNEIYLINIKENQHPIEGLKGHGCTIWCLDAFDDGYRIISGSSDNTIKLWDLNEWKCTGTLEGHQNSVSALKILKNGLLVSTSWDFTMKIWNLSTMLCIKSVCKHQNIIFSVIELEDGRLATSSKDRSIIIWKKI